MTAILFAGAIASGLAFIEAKWGFPLFYSLMRLDIMVIFPLGSAIIGALTAIGIVFGADKNQVKITKWHFLMVECES